MGRLQKSQLGFSVVEVLLALIFVAIVAFIGVYVAHNYSSKTTASTAKTSAPAKKTTVSTATTPPATTTTNSTQSYLPITEWGVKLPVSGALASAQYQDITSLYGTHYDTIQVTIPGASAADTCKGGVIGWVASVPDSDQGATEVYYSHIGSDSYVYEQAQDCTASSSLITQFEQAVAAMVAI